MNTETIFPLREEQNPQILSQINPIADKLIELFVNRDDRGSLQGLGADGRWGYYPTEIDHLHSALWSHLRSEQTWAFCAYGREKRSQWLCVDIDLKGTPLSPHTHNVVHKALQRVLISLKACGVPREALLLEFSGGKGVHVWVMLEECQTTACQRFWALFFQHLPALPTGIHLDLFPNPSMDIQGRDYGSVTKLPFAFHQQVGRYSCLIAEDGSEIEDPLLALNNVKRWRLPEDLPVKSTAKKFKHERISRGRKKKQKTILIEIPLQPAWTTRIVDLIENCEFMKTFFAHPEQVSYEEWKWAGMILTTLGEDGQQWFQYLSAKDVSRYDGTHADVIDSVVNRNYQPPTCRTLGCCQCSNASPFQCINAGSETHTFTLGERREKPSMTFEELQHSLKQQIEEFLDEQN